MVVVEVQVASLLYRKHHLGMSRANRKKQFVTKESLELHNVLLMSSFESFEFASLIFNFCCSLSLHYPVGRDRECVCKPLTSVSNSHSQPQCVLSAGEKQLKKVVER